MGQQTIQEDRLKGLTPSQAEFQDSSRGSDGKSDLRPSQTAARLPALIGYDPLPPSAVLTKRTRTVCGLTASAPEQATGDGDLQAFYGATGLEPARHDAQPWRALSL